MIRWVLIVATMAGIEASLAGAAAFSSGEGRAGAEGAIAARGERLAVRTGLSVAGPLWSETLWPVSAWAEGAPQ